jgi:hypothetical protein
MEGIAAHMRRVTANGNWPPRIARLPFHTGPVRVRQTEGGTPAFADPRLMEPQLSSRKETPQGATRKRGTTMENTDIDWQNELERRARIYDDIAAADRFEGTMTVLDYMAMTALTLVLAVGFWIWGA